MKKRGFEVVSAYEDKDIHIPVRKTKTSAGYDIEAAEDVVIPVFEKGIKPVLVPTGLKAFMESDECLLILNRSSGPKKGFILANSVGLIDSDYYNNPDNEGHIFFAFYNSLDKELEVKKGDVIGQAVFTKFLVTDDDNAKGERKGGFGSTDK
jgi:dUTP pyrophosphatase